jgi:serine/threonine protein kinase
MTELRILTHDPITKHENIIKFHGIAWETDPLDLQRKWPVLLMERATHGTLTDFLSVSGPQSILMKYSVALDVVLGLKILHRCGVLHGDIKSDNVLVLENRDPETRQERPVIAKLGDFSGVLFDMKDHAITPSRTRPWNAPEWKQRLSPASLLKTDVYSLGFLIYRIMTNGSHPFRDLPQESSLITVETMKADVQLLLDKGADPNFSCKRGSAINVAASLHYPDILSLLLSRSSDSPKTVEKSTSKSLLFSAITGDSLESPSSLFGRIRRHGRYWRSRAQETLQVLLDHGARDHLHDVPGLPGVTAVYLAVMCAEPDILSFLLDHGGKQYVNTFSRDFEPSETPRTPLSVAIKARKLETFQILLQHGADAKIKYYIPGISGPVTLLYE